MKNNIQTSRGGTTYNFADTILKLSSKIEKPSSPIIYYAAPACIVSLRHLIQTQEK